MKKTNNKSLKRLLSILLALSMCASMVCTTVFAEETVDDPAEPVIEADDQTTTDPSATPDDLDDPSTTPDDSDDPSTTPDDSKPESDPYPEIEADPVDPVYGEIVEEVQDVPDDAAKLEEEKTAADGAANAEIDQVTDAATKVIDQETEIVDAANGVIDAAAGQASAAAGQA